ncbi:MAG: two pore domain potassium channel family protein [Armatimonadetes bacterium]|nr:two pore domain potassium channel family protein [Armatimonadota bacterium]
MNIFVLILCVAALAYIIWEGFETLVLPRRIDRPLRGTHFFFQSLWYLWRVASRRMPGEGRDNFLSLFGPLSLLLLFVVWALGMVLAFAGIVWSLRIPIHAPEATPGFGTYLYLSATTFITLGYGDVSPLTNAGRVLCDIEAGVGFGFLAIIVAYLPVLYGAFSKREVLIALLDARASSPPSAGALLQRYAGCMSCGDVTDLPEFLRDWEKWCAELLESHLSYPVLMFYRSQHERQSWLSALTTLLDTCAFIIASMPQAPVWQARLTFAMARHAAIDLTLVFEEKPPAPTYDRLPPEDLAKLQQLIRDAGTPFSEQDEAVARLNELRALYEPYVLFLGERLAQRVPNWLPDPSVPDNWQTSAWDKSDHFFESEALRRSNARRR